MKTKKAASLTNWIETAGFSILFILALVVIIAQMNEKYGQNNDASFGLNSSMAGLKEYQDTLQKNIQEGEASTSTITGISLSSSWAMIKGGIGMTWGFITGKWIEIAVALVKLPMIVAQILRILFIISIGLIAIKLIMKVTP